ncbi:contactin-associated protein-like 5 isoform X2 [Montipora capricornis]|uniref:contactin-associated protein-like 5 isoform X2 n=1 Tax=Montipora capricornis TaxID=246305 RepID=UPI0035F1BFAC
MSHSREQVQKICSGIGVFRVCVLFALQNFTSSANGDRIITFKEPVPNKTMEDHVIRRDEVPNEGSCRVKCYLHPDCVSINMGPLTGGKLTCELNNATAQKESALGSEEGYTYLEIQNPCSSSPCLNGGTCQAGFTSKGFRCLCTNSSFAGIHCEAKSCSQLKRMDPAAESGEFVIDPDGKGNLASFKVTCNMTEKNGVGVTIISHDSENRTHVKGCEPAGCYSRDIQYTGASLSQLAMLTRVSSHCEQFIKYECYGSIIFRSKTREGWWVSRDSEKKTHWGGASGHKKCACGMTNSCANSRFGCNCDKNDKVWREDSGLLTNKTKLPVKQLRFGDTGDGKEEGYHTLGKFKCYGMA